VRLLWSDLAMKDRDEIFDFIEADSPRAAAEIDLRIRDEIRTLLTFPEAGRPGRIRGARELVIPQTPYIAAYRADGERIEILRVLHGARRWPKKI
jgi:addiction module RelE/StbE family toxin